MLLPILDPENKAKLVEWVQDNANASKLLFPGNLMLDIDALAAYEPPNPMMGAGGEKEPDEPPPFSGRS